MTVIDFYFDTVLRHYPSSPSPPPPGLYSVLFPKEAEAAFSNYKLWESLGFILAYICSTLLCVAAKIYILIACLALGVAGYAAIEVMEARRWRVPKMQ